jgi:hypothetical protein
MSHPQVGRSWLVHSSEEELSHHLQPPPANQLAKASPLPKKRFIIYRPVEPSRKQVVATAPRGCWTILIRRPIVSPPVKPSDTEVPSDPTGLETIND